MALLQRIAKDVKLMFRRPPRQQYAALCYRLKKKNGLEVLLLTSRDTGRWVIPKGWPMPNKKSHSVAEREAFEEAGVKGKAERAPLGSFTYHKGLDQGLKVFCRVQVHALKVESMLDDFPEKGQRQLAWVSCAEAAERVDEPELKALLLAFEQRMLGHEEPGTRKILRK
ncbi:NUDIX hydrolase [Rhizobiaceae bacterium n13]|uniref:NUDIX hydrolase n=1 Tax=Ferirhizobium litorale TaxID=2927786 RepID=A0AAE3QDT9_9HYPH|nr:NUDIX hydrolase [Fererhizobium litorale]MDI7864813.1 NUDIX hydrolase [Fererhizobium litorale]MDI7921725.1 NUDIX hydrolase [Fererhizobium litorale]